MVGRLRFGLFCLDSVVSTELKNYKYIDGSLNLHQSILKLNSYHLATQCHNARLLCFKERMCTRVLLLFIQTLSQKKKKKRKEKVSKQLILILVGICRSSDDVYKYDFKVSSNFNNMSQYFISTYLKISFGSPFKKICLITLLGLTVSYIHTSLSIPVQLTQFFIAFFTDFHTGFVSSKILITVKQFLKYQDNAHKENLYSKLLHFKISEICYKSFFEVFITLF